MPKIIEVNEPESIIRYGGSKMLIAPPAEYDSLIKTIQRGKITTTEIIRKHLAKKHNAEFTCPLTAGIFINICAYANDERGGVDETPYWRVLKKDGELNDKFPGGTLKQKDLLTLEGHTIEHKGKRMFVKDYLNKTQNFNY